ncbi:unannotated protein [freshwater metagenome]|uniref:Unannotated protein n=1 Tax=freshwater metagenome TaxID=449393 RepID=A0A6J6W744_9ZZZZ
MGFFDQTGVFKKHDAVGGKHFGLGPPLNVSGYHLQVVRFQNVIRIGESHPSSTSYLNAGVASSALPGIFLGDHPHRVVGTGLELLKERKRIVQRSIVDQDQFDAGMIKGLLRERIEEIRQVLLNVVDR